MKTKLTLALIYLFATVFAGCTKDEPPVVPETGDAPIKINEAYSNGGRSTYGALDWVELYNNSDAAFDVGGYVLYDKVDKSEKVTIPANTIITAGGFLVVEVDIDGGFGLGSGGDMVHLEDKNGLLIDKIEFGALTPEQSYARSPDGSVTFKIQMPTPGASNNGVVAQPSITGLAHDPVSPTSDEDVTVTATVTAGEGTLTSVKVQWTLNTASQTDIAMTNTANTYTATIPKQAAGAEITYSVVALNSAGGSVTAAGTAYTVRDDAVIDYSGLVINEVDGNGKFIELYNTGMAAIPLAGVTLKKNESATWWTGGSTVTITAGGYYTIVQNGESTAGASEYTGASGISPKKTVRFDLIAPDGSTSIDVFARVKSDNILDANCTPDYGSGTKYSFSRCPDGTGSFGLALPSCNAANPATAAGNIETN